MIKFNFNLLAIYLIIPLFLSSLYVNILGNVYLFELFAIGFFIISFLYGGKFRKTEFFLFVFGGLLLIRVLLSEEILSPDNVAWFGTFFILIVFLMGLIAFSRYRWSRVFCIYAGASLGFAVSVVAFGNDAMGWVSEKPLLERAFSFGHIPLFILALMTLGRSKTIAIILIIGAVCVALMYSDRGKAAVYLAAVVGVLATTLLKANRPKKRRSLPEYIITVAGICVAALVAGEAFVLGAKIGLFNDRFNDKILRQAEHEYGFIAGARPDQIPMIKAILKKPIFGHGVNGPEQSWAINMMLLSPEMQKLDGNRLEAYIERGLVLHSGILGAWVRYGIFGGIFWGIILLLSVKVLRDYLGVSGWQSVLVVACATDLIFEALFEPGRLRFAIALNLMVVFTALRWDLKGRRIL